MSPFIVGIGHVAQVGKNVAADGLVRDLGFQIVAFADQLRDLAMQADPLVTSATRTVNTAVGHGKYKWVVQGLGYEQAKATYPEVRGFLQRLGVGARTVFGEDFWIDQAMSRAARFGRVVMPDVRFVNEAEAIKAMGGVVIRIDRLGRVAFGHESETALRDWDGWDEVFENDHSVPKIQADVVAFVKNKLQVSGALVKP